MTWTRINVAVIAVALTALTVAPPAQATEPPTTPTISDLSVVAPVVQDGDDVELAWSGDNGGVELFVVRATFRDFDWGTHEVVDGVGDTPTTGVMRAAVDPSWASGPAVPTKVEIIDIGGDGRVYHADDERTPENEARVTVWRDGQLIDTEYGGPDLFGNVVINIREELTDTEAPQFDSLSTSQTTALPGDFLTLNWSGSDDHTGIRGIRVQFSDSDGELSEVEKEYVYGIPPTSGQILLPVPTNASEGIYEVMRISVFDNACNERFYVLSGPDAQPMSTTGDCGLGTFDRETLMPDELSIAPLAVGVVMARPPMEVPLAPTGVTGSCSVDRCQVTWQSTHSWTGTDKLHFYDWLYQVELDGEVVSYPWPETEVELYNDEVPPGEHVVRVRAVNRSGVSAWSDDAVFTTYGPGTVLTPTAMGRLWGARVTWSTPSEGDAIMRYLLVRRTGIRTVDEMPQPNSSDPETTSTSFADLAVATSRSYTYAVYAVDWDGQVSEQAAITQLVGTRTRVRDALLNPGRVHKLRGKVTDLAGEGVPAARVVIQRAPATSPSDFSTKVASTTTGPDGTYRLALTPRRDFVYRVATPGTIGFGPSWSDTLG